MLIYIRQKLLDEAAHSPALLSDLAGLETYIAESYDARSFVELLQNADDAGASRFAVQRLGEMLFVANDGREFTGEDFESLCRSAASAKKRGASIGYRGIGFKSVVGFAKVIHIFSGGFEATFSRELTEQAIPEATRVPLVRIPHPIEPTLRFQLAAMLDTLRSDGFKTVFVFTDLIASGIEAEFAAFDPTSLLFLREIRQVELKSDMEAVVSVKREAVNSDTHSISLKSSEDTTNWTVIERDGAALAFSNDEGGITRLEERQATVHAFLPTLESTGFAFKVNGDLSTDPSRTRIILDDRTAISINSIARAIVDLINECISENPTHTGAKLLAALVPVSDPRMAGFQRRGFKTELYSAIKRDAGERFHKFLCRPQWLNAMDFSTLTEASGGKVVPRHLEGIEGLNAFLKFLGAKEASLKDFSPALSRMAPTMTGAAEIVAHLTNLHATKQIDAGEIGADWKIWPVDNTPLSLGEAERESKSLSEIFTDLITEKSGSGTELPRILEKLTSATTSAMLLPAKLLPAQPTSSPLSFGIRKPDVTPNQPFSLKRWRGAEQQVHSVLEKWGWRVEDVSRQNIGYDIEGYTPEGDQVCVEVKSLDYPGQAFTLTSNEEAVAREKGDRYQLALVRQTNEHLEISFITNPATHLKLTRQCRQWVWECSTYDFNPVKFALDAI